MSRPDSCDLGCGAEERLDLVAAEEHDALAGSVRESQARGEALRDAVRPLTSAPPDVQAAYLALQASARAVLREQPAPPPLPEPALAEERRLRELVRRAATVTPRSGRWEHGWAALATTVVPPDA
jgi:hypothetical protein